MNCTCDIIQSEFNTLAVLQNFVTCIQRSRDILVKLKIKNILSSTLIYLLHVLFASFSIHSTNWNFCLYFSNESTWLQNLKCFPKHNFNHKYQLLIPLLLWLYTISGEVFFQFTHVIQILNQFIRLFIYRKLINNFCTAPFSGLINYFSINFERNRKILFEKILF